MARADQLEAFEKLCNAHAGSMCWIFGKGPSLDRFDLKLVPDSAVRIIIKENVSYVPAIAGRTYWIPGFRECRKYIGQGPWPGVVPVFPANWHGARWKHPAASFLRNRKTVCVDLAVANAKRELFSFLSCSSWAIHLAWYLGAKHVCLVGCDGVGQYSRRLVEGGLVRQMKGEMHPGVRRMNLLLLEALSPLTWEFYGERVERSQQIIEAGDRLRSGVPWEEVW